MSKRHLVFFLLVYKDIRIVYRLFYDKILRMCYNSINKNKIEGEYNKEWYK